MSVIAVFRDPHGGLCAIEDDDGHLKEWPNEAAMDEALKEHPLYQIYSFEALDIYG